MNIYELLKNEEGADFSTLGNKYLRLKKCYEFVLQESTDTEVRSILEDKYNIVKNLEKEAPSPALRAFGDEKGLQPLFVEAINAFDSFTDLESFNNAVRLLGEAYSEEPNSVMNQALAMAVNEVIAYFEANPSAT